MTTWAPNTRVSLFQNIAVKKSMTNLVFLSAIKQEGEQKLHVIKVRRKKLFFFGGGGILFFFNDFEEFSNVVFCLLATTKILCNILILQDCY